MVEKSLNSLQVNPEEELDHIFKMSLHCICIADINTTNFLQVNPAFETILGYKPEELINKSFLDYIHPDDIQPTKEIVEKNLRLGKKIIHFENRYFRKDGSVVWLDWVSHPDVEKGITYAIGSDITQKKNMELDLKESERKFRTLFEKSTDPILILENGIFTDCNKAATAILGYKSKRGIVGKRPQEISPDLQSDGLSSEEKAGKEIKIARENGYNRFEWVHLDRNKNEILLDVALTDISEEGSERLFTIWRDITTARRNEEALRNKKKELEEIFNTMPDALVYATSNRKIMKVNQAFERLFGYKEEEVLGKETRILYENEGEFLKQGKLRYNIDVRDVFDTYEIRYKKKNGDVFLSESIGTPVRDAEDNVVGLLGIVRDITEKRNAEKALHESQERFFQLFNNMADGVAIYEPDEEGMHFRFVDVNSAGERISHIKRSEVKGKYLHDLFPGASIYGLVQAMRKVYKTGTPKFIPLKEYQDKRISQWVENYVFKLPSGNLVAIYKDTSKEKKNVYELKEYKDRLDLAMESAGQGVWEFDFNTNMVTFDRIAARMLGYSKYSLTEPAEDAFARIHPEDYDNALKAFDDYLHDKAADYQQQFRIRCRDNSYIWIHSFGKILRRNEDGTPALVIGLHTDITKRKKNEAELKKYRSHLEELVNERTREIEEKNMELERMNSLFVGREFRIKELREMVKELKEKLKKKEE